MARIRSVHPAIYTDAAFVNLSLQARYFLIGLWTEADDHGVFPWDPRTLKFRLLPGDDGDAADLLRELTEAGAVLCFNADGATFGAIRHFCTDQRPDRPTFLHPLPPVVARFVSEGVTLPPGPRRWLPWAVSAIPNNAASDRREIGESSPSARRTVGDCSAADQGEIEPDRIGEERKGEERNSLFASLRENARGTVEGGSARTDMRGGGGGGGPAEEPPPPLPRRSARKDRGIRLPEDWHPGKEGEAFARNLGLDPAETLESFRDHWRAAAGASAAKANWAAAWRNWCRRELRPKHSREADGRGASWNERRLIEAETAVREAQEARRGQARIEDRAGTVIWGEAEEERR